MYQVWFAASVREYDISSCAIVCLQPILVFRLQNWGSVFALCSASGYIYWGYAPLSIRLVELALKQQKPRPVSSETGESTPWRGRGADALNVLPGKCFDITVDDDADSDSANTTLKRNEDSVEIVLVVFIGGVTFSEISALRLLSSLPNSKVKFIVATTGLMNGNSFVETFQDKVVKEMMKVAKDSLLS